MTPARHLLTISCNLLLALRLDLREGDVEVVGVARLAEDAGICAPACDVLTCCLGAIVLRREQLEGRLDVSAGSHCSVPETSSVVVFNKI